jgi:YesN/AraC family two-component response regulator
MFKEYQLPFDSELAFRMVAYKGSPLQECELVDSRPCLAVPMLSSGTLLLFQNLPATEERHLLQDLKNKGAILLVTTGRIDSVRQLPRLAHEMDEQLRFSFLHQVGSIITIKNTFRVHSVNVYPTDLEKTLLQILHQGKAAEALKVYEGFFGQVTTGSYDHFKFAMKRLFISLQLAVNELQKQGLFAQYKGMAIEEFEALIGQLDNRAVLDCYFSNLFGEFRDEVTASRLKRAGRISDQMMEILDRDYPDPNLSLQSLADSVGMSPSYVAKVFKECAGVSVNEYLLNLRLEKAKRLLLEESLPAREIASRVGLDNENYFYTVFRKKTGQTPNAFRKERQRSS